MNVSVERVSAAGLDELWRPAVRLHSAAADSFATTDIQHFIGAYISSGSANSAAAFSFSCR